MPKWDQISSSLLDLTSQKMSRFGNLKVFLECFGKYNNFSLWFKCLTFINFLIMLTH